MKLDAKYNERFLSGVLLLLVLFVSLGAVWYRYYLPQRVPETSYSLPAGQQGRISTEDAFFSTKTLNQPETISLSLPFKFESDSFPIWVDLKANETSPFPILTRLAYHPDLATNNWPFLLSPPLTLFQRVAEFSSVEQFLQSPPANSRILADPQLIELYDLPATPLGDKIDFNSVDYILTTYTPPLKQNGYHVYTTSFDGSQAHVSSDNLLSWQMRAPLATQSAYFIGQIFVDL